MAFDNDTKRRDISPEDAFAVLGNETRINILRSLWDAAPEPVPFGTLRKNVGMPDSGHFNYHLDKVEGPFVRYTGDGYTLRLAGEYVIRAVLAGIITERPAFEPTELDAKCPCCGGTSEAWYADEIFTARCTRCEGVIRGEEYPTGTFLRYDFPPAGLVDRTPDEVLTAAHTLYDAKLTAMLGQVCPECAATVEFSFDICTEHETPEEGLCPACESRHEIWVTAVCENCRYRRQFIVWFAVVTNPAVIAFYHDQGVPWERIPFPKLTWENASYVGDIDEDVISEEPLRVRVTIPADDETLSVTIDEELNVIDVARDVNE